MKQLSLAYQALAAILLGIFAGLFFGPLCSFIRPIGDVFIMLLQMTALPYICFSLIHGLGSITPKIAKKLLKEGGAFLAILWSIVFLMIYLLSFLIPTPLSTSLGKLDNERIFTENFLEYIVPQNPFYDLANNVVPAIAVFGLIVGTAVMHLKEKEPLLSLLERTNSAIEKIFVWLAHVAPIAIFAHIAYAVGSVNFDDLFKLEYYVLVFIVVTLFITFVILPILLSNLTGLHYREIIKEFQRACLLAFATGVPSIAFPFIIRVMRNLAAKHSLNQEKFHTTSQTIIPLGYSFAQIGNCFVLFFILFLSFFFRHPFALAEKALLSLLTIPLSFGAAPIPINAIRFLINQLGFPKQALELFNETMSITIHFQVLLSVASILTFAILVIFSYYGLLKIRWKRLAIQLFSAIALFTTAVFFVKENVQLTDNYQNLYLKLKVADVVTQPVQAVIHRDSDSWDNFQKIKRGTEGLMPLQRILKTGVLRVGYDTKNIPYCYVNENNELVGYDIAYAFQLARDLDCKLELFPMSPDALGKQLDEEFYDVAMSAVIMDEKRLTEMDFSNTYAEEENVLVIPEKKKKQFINYQAVFQNSQLKMGGIGGYRRVALRHFPYAQFTIEADTESLVAGEIDALVWSRTNAFIWCLNHPGFVVVNFHDLLGKKYFAYPVKNGAYQLLEFLNNWLYLKEQQGFKAEQEKYWILGITPESEEPRWSIIRDLLHWVE